MMKSWHHQALFIGLLIFSNSTCVSPSAKSSKSDVLSLDSWADWKSIRLEERISSASAAMVDFIREENIKHDIPSRPYQPAIDGTLRNDIRQAISSLPDQVKKLLDKKLAGIVLIEGLGSTGFSDIIRDEGGKASAGFIILDAKMIDKKANAWATWKENTPFTNDPKVSVKAIIENTEDNTRVQTIQYILLHEIGHILAIGETFHPPWDEPMKAIDALEPYPFTSVSWKLNAQNFQYEPIGVQEGSGCESVAYYSEAPRLSRKQAESCYRALEQTAFVSLYASTNPFDDFAETFAFYVHRVLLKKPWHLEIESPSGIYRYEPLWNEARIQRKRKIMENFFPG